MDYFRGDLCDPTEFIFVGDRQHAVKTGGTIHQDGLNYTLVQ